MLLKVDDTLKREFMVHMNGELGDFQRTINESKQHVDDIREQEDIEAKRCYNVILCRVPVGNAILSEDRRNEDTTFCQKKKKPKPTSVDHKTSVVIPYFEGVSEAVARVTV